jgi:hypothetical protein
LVFSEDSFDPWLWRALAEASEAGAVLRDKVRPIAALGAGIVVVLMVWVMVLSINAK